MTSGTFNLDSSVFIPTPFKFALAKEIPPHLVDPIKAAVTQFSMDSRLDDGVDRLGFCTATIESIAGASYLGAPGSDLWLGTNGNELYAYVLARVTREIDNRLTYWVYQAWVRRDQRGKPWVRDAWQQIRARAKKSLCAHIVVVSSRGEDAYCRWLGSGWHKYASLLKEDI